jgi:hypothetical protein
MFLIQVVSFRPAAPMTNPPIQTLPSPLILSPAPFPKAVLLAPVVFILSAPTPIAVLKLPPVLALKADAPLAVLPSAVVLLKSALSPTAVLKLPVVLLTRAIAAIGRVMDAGGVEQKRCSTGGRIDFLTLELLYSFVFIFIFC